MIRIALVLVALLIAGQAGAAECSPADQRHLGDELDHLKGWDNIHASFRKYTPQCDDGFFAEGYSNAMVVRLARRWSSVATLDRIGKSDLLSREFVLRHIDATTAPGDLKTVVSNSSARCPSAVKAPCADIESAAKRAIKHL